MITSILATVGKTALEMYVGYCISNTTLNLIADAAKAINDMREEAIRKAIYKDEKIDYIVKDENMNVVKLKFIREKNARVY